MKTKFRLSLVAVLLLSSFARLEARDEIDQYATETKALWEENTGSGASDGAYTAISTSMLAWGVGIGAGAALLAAAFSQGGGGHSH